MKVNQALFLIIVLMLLKNHTDFEKKVVFDVGIMTHQVSIDYKELLKFILKANQFTSKVLNFTVSNLNSHLKEYYFMVLEVLEFAHLIWRKIQSDWAFGLCSIHFQIQAHSAFPHHHLYCSSFVSAPRNSSQWFSNGWGSWLLVFKELAIYWHFEVAYLNQILWNLFPPLIFERTQTFILAF